jgi:hypothetical protein
MANGYNLGTMCSVSGRTIIISIRAFEIGMSVYGGQGRKTQVLVSSINERLFRGGPNAPLSPWSSRRAWQYTGRITSIVCSRRSFSVDCIRSCAHAHGYWAWLHTAVSRTAQRRYVDEKLFTQVVLRQECFAAYFTPFALHAIWVSRILW